MLSYSPSINFVWQIAAMETAGAALAFVEREQVFIGLLKVCDILDDGVRAKIAPHLSETDIDLLTKELLPLEEFFSEFNIDRTELRRYIRGIIGKGNHVHSERVVHRSGKCKGYFKRAEEIALARHSLTLKPVHILEAILEEPGEIVSQSLSKFGGQPQDMKEAVGKAEEKEHVTVGGNKEKEHNDKKSKTPFLDRYGVDLTRLAGDGKIEPMIGRREELLKVIRTLARKTKNNPLLIGDAGVGKTAIAKGLALRIAQKNITPALQDKRLIEISMAGLVAGTKYRGEFEDRILKILDEARKNDNVILFIDEIHTVVGAGAAEGALDAANIMKPALAAGEISCIGATTLSEYRKYIEKDAALERRFQAVMVEEPTEKNTLEILTGLKENYEAHHQVIIMPEALRAAVGLSVKYLPDRRLPDKALDIIDEACSRVKVDTLSFYGNIEDTHSITGQVTEDVVAMVVAAWSGRPVERPNTAEQEKLSHIEGELRRKVIGQDNAIEKVAQTVRMARAGLRDPRRPTGVFLFLGPTGVGKTELAKTLSSFLFGSEGEMIRLDMSEYMEKHNVAKLIGAPPGYIGYDEEGQLTGRLRRKPYSVVLLDEIEKAHSDLLNIFLQLFDEGRLTDAKGRTVDARNAIFIMTSNIGAELLKKSPIGFGGRMEEEKELEYSHHIKDMLPPEFINRIDEIIVFRDLRADDVASIVSLLLADVKGRLKDKGIVMEISEDVIPYIAQEGYDLQYGARHLARTVERVISKPLAAKIINGEIKAGDKLLVHTNSTGVIIERGGKNRK